MSSGKYAHKIVIVGASGHGKSIYEAARCGEQYDVVGFVDDADEVESPIRNCPLLGKCQDLPRLIQRHSIAGGIVAIGDNFVRAKCMKVIRGILPDFDFVSIIHPSATVSADVDIGAGTCILGAALVNIHCRVGEGCIINTGSQLDHDGYLGDYVSLAPGAILGGDVRVDEYSAVSIGVTIIHGIRVGAHTVVGAGSVVVKDLPASVLGYGVPTKVVRSRKPSEPYL